MYSFIAITLGGKLQKGLLWQKQLVADYYHIQKHSTNIAQSHFFMFHIAPSEVKKRGG